MRRVLLQDSGSGLHLLFTFLVVVAAWLVFQLVAILSGALIYGVGFYEIQPALNAENPAFISYQKYIQSLISTGMFIAAPWMVAWSLSSSPGKYLKLDSFPGLSIAFLSCLLMILSLPMNNYFTYLNNLIDIGSFAPAVQEYFEGMESRAEDLFERFLDVKGLVPLLINLLVIAIIPGVGEELLFRGIIQKLFIRWTNNTFIGVLLASLAFAILHLQFLSVLPRFILGMVLGYLFVWTKSLWMPILAHFVNNAFAVVYYFLMYNGKISDRMESLGNPENVPYYALLSIIVVFLILFVIRRMMREKFNQAQREKLSAD